jgi:murein DD-endopeptidase MepM/ murein hydrolase activator NlpD
VLLQDVSNTQVFYLGAHMNNITANEGDILKPGQSTGTSGATGVGGPHFHTGTYIIPSGNFRDFWRSDSSINNNQAVNPYDHSERWIGRNK